MLSFIDSISKHNLKIVSIKKHLTSSKILLTFFAILTIIIFAKFFTLLDFPDSSIILEKSDPILKLRPSESFSQKFIANRDNLMKVEILLRAPGPKPNDLVRMEIADENCKKIIRTGKLEKSYLNSDNLFEFSFSKIPDSNSKTFCLIATFKPEKSTSKAIQFFTQSNKQPLFSVQNSSSDGDLTGQALSTRPVYANDHWWQNLSELSQRMSQYKPWFLKDFFNMAIITLFIILSAGFVVIIILL